MAQVEILSETERGGGWTFRAQLLLPDGSLRAHDISLSFADYNHWSQAGADPPASVAWAVLSFLCSRDSQDELKPSFDASIARRLHADADVRIPTYITDLP